MSNNIVERIKDGRTDLVFDHRPRAITRPRRTEARHGALSWCAYYGDVSAIRILANGESIRTLGDNLTWGRGYGHWRCASSSRAGQCESAVADNGETPLHAALSQSDRLAHDLVLKVLLGSGANPNCATKPGIETGSFMRDCRTKGETPLHRAAAFGTEDTIRLLLDAGARINAQDADGNSPLGWASCYLRPDTILRILCYGDFHIRPNRRSMRRTCRASRTLERVAGHIVPRENDSHT
jgi:hypothetical protein